VIKKGKKEKENKDHIRFGFTDIVAMTIAVIQVLFPYFLVLFIGWAIFIWFATTFWLK